MTNHPLTETAAAELWDKHVGDTVPWGDWYGGSRRALTSLLRAAHDVGREHERANPDAARPWEPLNGPVRVGDEVRREFNGITVTAVVGRVDDDGDPWAAGGGFIGVLEHGTWYVRRAVQELPTEDGAVIVPTEGREFIEAEVAGQTFIAREAVVCQSDFGPANVLEGAWRRADTGARVGGQVSRNFITPGTWKVDEQ